MVFAIAENRDFCDCYHVVPPTEIVLVFKGGVKHLGNLRVGIVHALEYLGVHFRHTVGCFFQSFTVRVITEGGENASDVFTNGIFIYSHVFFPPFILRAVPAAR